MIEYGVELTGTMPLLMHADDVQAADELDGERKNPENKKTSVPGDDRSPPWSWQTYLYHDGTHLTLPQENVMRALRSGAAQITMKKTTTFKAASQSGIMFNSDFLAFTNNGEPVVLEDILAFRDAKFADHIKECRKLGFDLLVKRATMPTGKKNVRVRPRFDHWKATGTVMVSEPAITQDILGQMFDLAGRYAGLCDWRPSAPKSPGPFGTFTARVLPVKAARRTG